MWHCGNTVPKYKRFIMKKKQRKQQQRKALAKQRKALAKQRKALAKQRKALAKQRKEIAKQAPSEGIYIADYISVLIERLLGITPTPIWRKGRGNATKIDRANNNRLKEARKIANLLHKWGSDTQVIKNVHNYISEINRLIDIIMIDSNDKVITESSEAILSYILENVDDAEESLDELENTFDDWL